MAKVIKAVSTLLLILGSIVGSIALIALLLACVVVTFPVLVLGNTLKVGGWLSNKMIDWLFPPSMDINVMVRNSQRAAIIAIPLSLIMIAASAIPVGVLSAAAVVFCSVVATPVLFIVCVVTASMGIINYVYPQVEEEEDKPNQGYGALFQNSSSQCAEELQYSEEPQHAPLFGSVGQAQTSIDVGPNDHEEDNPFLLS